MRVVNVAPSAVVSVDSALSPGSLLFPFSDFGFASLSAASSSRPLSLPPPLSSSSSLASSSPASASFLSSLPPTPAFPSPFAPPFSSCSSFSASASLPPPPPGFPPLPPSVSPPLPSSSLFSASSTPSFSSLPPFCASSSAGQVASIVVSSSSSFSSSSLDFASYQVSVLGLSHDYQCLAPWYFQSGGSDFRSYLSAFYSHLSSDASRDFTSGSSVFFSALRSVASSVPLPSVSSVLCPPSSSAALPLSQPLAPLFSAPSSVSLPSLGSLSAPQGWGVSALGSASVVSSAPPGFPPLSAPSSLFSGPPPAVSSSTSSMPPAAPVLAPPSSSFFSSAPPVLSGFVAPGWGSSPAVSVVPPLAPGPQPSLFRPFTVSDPPLISAASASAPLSSTLISSAAGPSGFASAASGSASGHAGFPPQHGPSSYIPLQSDSSAAPSAPPLSPFAYPPDNPFAPGFADPEASSSAAPVPPPLSDSIRAEVRHMYQYLVDLFPQAAGSSQAPPPLRALFEEFSLRHLLISQCILCGSRESALLSLRLTPTWCPCSLVAVRSLRFCLLVTPSIPSMVRLRWAPLLR